MSSWRYIVYIFAADFRFLAIPSLLLRVLAPYDAKMSSSLIQDR